MSERSADLLLDDIYDSIEKIERYIKGMTAENFMKDEKTIDAVVRNLEIIGEATVHIDANQALFTLEEVGIPEQLNGTMDAILLTGKSQSIASLKHRASATPYTLMSRRAAESFRGKSASIV